MRRVILESPYAGDVDRNTIYLRRCLRDSIMRGEAPFASHAIYCGPLDDALATERELGLSAGAAWRQVASACVVYVDYGESPGMLAGIMQSDLLGHVVERRAIGQNQVDTPPSLPTPSTSSGRSARPDEG